ncbi:hypothetical protein [Halomarina litorea]|uniref:hypothetical protein n=1 Tax=Halomarina litorea TaxID=2961595 RepID=UPI0020C41B0A|nr:hypothetical protein [Halomarina sp. BCD28]
MGETYKPRVTARDRERLAADLGTPEVSADGEATFADLRAAVAAGADPQFASMGAAIRADLRGQLDAERIDEALAGLDEQLRRAEEVREVGVPERVGKGDAGVPEAYRELIAPVWEAYDHLVEVGFFESLSSNLPAFTPEHIDGTARGLLTADALATDLADVGFDERERTALLMDVVNNDTRLSRWVPTADIPEGVEFNVDYVPPLYHRAVGGGLLWVKSLDRHLVQKEILLTEDVLDDAFWRAKAILGGVAVFLRAARDVASDEPEQTDEQLVAGLSGGAAITIVNQEELMREAYWLTEEKRAPTRAR